MMSYFKFILTFLIITFSASASSFATIESNTTKGEQKVLVILVKFPDLNPTFSAEKLKDKYFDKLDIYLKAVSYKKAWIKVKMTDWYTLPHNVDYYHISKHNFEVEKDKVTALIQDVVNLADEDEDFSNYDMLFISLGARQRDYGMMGLCGYPGMLGWKNRLEIKTDKNGQKVPEGVAIYCENAHVGVVFHDMGHIMGGLKNGRRVLPCLYDHELQAQKGTFRLYYQFYLTNVGYFDPMSCHYYELKKFPPGLCAWSKIRLGWIESEKIVEVNKGKSETVLLAPLSSGYPKVHVVKVPVSSTTYYLIENRQSIGPDENLPSYGVCIYYCDDEVAECLHGKTPVKMINANPSVSELKGAPFTLEGKSSFADEKNNVIVKLIEKEVDNYKIYVSNDK
ncbi:MAG: hypothetical protein H8D45_00760 [Bacteroidetes bacterium]|nr:hypothetical protein [Bacteroidota bacterium]